MKRQTGSILMLMMLILIVGGATVMYTLLNQSTEKLRLGQSEKQMAHLNAIKNRLLVFAENPTIFCPNTDLEIDRNIKVGDPNFQRFFPLPTNNNKFNIAAFTFGFEDLVQISQLDYIAADRDDSTLAPSLQGCVVDSDNNLFNFCQIDEADSSNSPNFAIELRLPNENSPSVYIYRNEVCR